MVVVECHPAFDDGSKSVMDYKELRIVVRCVEKETYIMGRNSQTRYWKLIFCKDGFERTLRSATIVFLGIRK